MLRKSIIILGLSVALAGCAGTPRVYSVWMKCDGGPEPKGLGTEMAQLILASSTLGIFGMPEMPNARAKLTGDAGVQACTEVLAMDALKGNWKRHVSVLRARSIHHLEADNIVAALADVRAIYPLIPESFGGPGGSRGPDLAAKLLESFVERDAGNHEAAARLLIEIADARPYSVSVQALVAKYMPLQAFGRPEGAHLLDRLIRQEPEALQLRASQLEWDPEGAARGLDSWRALIAHRSVLAIPGKAETAGEAEPVADSSAKKKRKKKKSKYKRLREQAARQRAKKRLAVRERREKALAPTPASAEILHRAALAAARAGDMDQARAWLAESRDRPQSPIFSANDAYYAAVLKALSENQGTSATALQALLGGNASPAVADSVASVVEIYGHLHAGNSDLAREQLSQLSRFPQTAATLELVDQLRESDEPGPGGGPLSIDTAKARQNLLAKRSKLDLSPQDLGRMFAVLPISGRPKSKNHYSGQWGLGLKSNGFDERQRLNGWQTIEFVGTGVTRTGVEEMTLMRAAELAKEAGKPAFIIADRRDYNRYSQTTYNGTPIGPRTHVGFKSEVDVIFVDPAALPAEWQDHGDRVMDAEQIWLTLAPYYLK